MTKIIGKQLEEDILRQMSFTPDKRTLEYDILYGANNININSLEYEIINQMEEESWWIKEMKKEHNFEELCRCLEMASFERACPSCYYNQLRLGKKEHGII